MIMECQIVSTYYLYYFTLTLQTHYKYVFNLHLKQIQFKLMYKQAELSGLELKLYFIF